jgi:hypothetical protein
MLHSPGRDLNHAYHQCPKALMMIQQEIRLGPEESLSHAPGKNSLCFRSPRLTYDQTRPAGAILLEETAIGGRYFHPMPQDRWQMMSCELVHKFSFLRPRWLLNIMIFILLLIVLTIALMPLAMALALGWAIRPPHGKLRAKLHLLGRKSCAEY